MKEKSQTLKISIIIATYNASETIKRCLDSIVSQRNALVEIIVIDGQSTDSTLSIVKSYASAVAFLVSEPDKGIYDAWNKGILHANGEWVMFLGADDQLMPGSLETYIDFLANGDHSKIDIICSKAFFANKKGKVVTTIGQPYNYMKFQRYMSIAHGTTLHNKRLFKELGYFSLEYKICADYEFLLRKELMSEFIDRAQICVQAGGVSFSIRMLIDTFRIKRKVKCSPLIADLFYFSKGVVSLYAKKLILCIV